MGSCNGIQSDQINMNHTFLLFVIATIVVGLLNFSTGKVFLIEENEDAVPENMYPDPGMDYECIAFCNINLGFDNSRTKNDIGTQQNVKTLNKNQDRKSNNKKSEQQTVPKAKQESKEATLNKNDTTEHSDSEQKQVPRAKKTEDREETTTNSPIEQISKGVASFLNSPIMESITGGVASMLGAAGRNIADDIARSRYHQYYSNYYSHYYPYH